MASSITARDETGLPEPYRHVPKRIRRPTGTDYPKESRAMIGGGREPGEEREAGPRAGTREPGPETRRACRGSRPRDAGPETRDAGRGTRDAGTCAHTRDPRGGTWSRVGDRPKPQYWNSSSRYFGSGQSSSATCDSSASATSRSFAWAGITWSRKAFASAMTDPASCASCCACSRSWIASTSESASDETFSHMCVTPRDDGPAADSRPRYVTAAGRTRVLAMSRAHDASMFETLT